MQFQNRESEVNKTETALDNGESFTGTWEDVSEFSEIRSFIKTDVDTTFRLQFSPDGVNQDSSLTYEARAGIPAGQSVTQQCIYHCGSSSQAIAKFLWNNINKLSGGGTPRVTVKGYVFNRPVTTKFEVFRLTVDTAAENTLSITEPIGFKLSAGDVLYFVADTDTNAAAVNLRFSLFEYENVVS